MILFFPDNRSSRPSPSDLRIPFLRSRSIRSSFERPSGLSSHFLFRHSRTFFRPFRAVRPSSLSPRRRGRCKKKMCSKGKNCHCHLYALTVLGHHYVLNVQNMQKMLKCLARVRIVFAIVMLSLF